MKIFLAFFTFKRCYNIFFNECMSLPKFFNDFFRRCLLRLFLRFSCFFNIFQRWSSWRSEKSKVKKNLGSYSILTCDLEKCIIFQVSRCCYQKTYLNVPVISLGDVCLGKLLSMVLLLLSPEVFRWDLKLKQKIKSMFWISIKKLTLVFL